MRQALLLSVTFILASLTTSVFAVELEYVRNQYDKIVTDKELCKTLLAGLEKKASSHTDRTYLGYLGACQTIWANHTGNPISKLSTFNKGKKNIEKAVQANPNNVELRFIRLSVQKNCPSFLGYSDNIQEDRQFIQKHKSQITSSSLQKLVDKIL